MYQQQQLMVHCFHNSIGRLLSAGSSTQEAIEKLTACLYSSDESKINSFLLFLAFLTVPMTSNACHPALIFYLMTE